MHRSTRMDIPWHHRTVAVATFVVLFASIVNGVTTDNPESMPHNEVANWAQKIGSYVYTLANHVTHYNDLLKRYNDEGANLSPSNGLSLVSDMAEDVTNMMKYKVQAVMRIMNVAEEANLDPSLKNVGEVDYFYAKKLNRYYEDGHKKAGKLMEGDKFLEMNDSPHFQALVNLSESTVHVPTNVYENGPDVMDAVRWSEALERIFISNYELDPTLTWQYFGSSAGFLRQYPATKWVMDEKDPDLYDSRLRTWYISAANSPKDMLILLDVSGSMTGLRREIARHVVLNILDTLNENDFVNIFIFSEHTEPLVECFNDTLVQANLENIGQFKRALTDLKTQNIANFTSSLSKAFELLQRYNKSGQGSQCNQAIMLVTDGAPYKFDEIFSKYNWPHLQVRLFTYLIGREVADVANLRWMACANKGYFVHVTTLAEVREQVLKYVPVMARPMVMYQDTHPHIWTGVYADIASPVPTIQTIEISDRPDKVFGRRDKPGDMGYRLMTTVSVPVFDRKKTSARTANLLGVAGADVPIREIQKLVPPYKLGVNGYSFMVNKNGHILYHPDLRPIHEESNAEFQDILKPNYNSVDLAEVELVDNYDEPRYNHTELRMLRRDMITHTKTEAEFQVKIHMDDMKRVVVRKQDYFAYPVEQTSFSLGIAMPKGYGKYRVNGQIELSLQLKQDKFNASDYFSSGQWRLHPEWVYCEYKYDQDGPEQTPEALMLHFLSRAQSRGWKWRSTRTSPPQEITPHACDKDLVQDLLFDAKITNVYDTTPSLENDFTKDTGHKNFGITSSFIATRSGLTRWTDLTDKDDSKDPTEPHYLETHNKAIDEVWYKRAVDYYLEDPHAYVYSVPFDAYTRNPEDVLVTASRAIFIEENKFRRAPAAVVGVTIKLKNFQTYFKNETFKCPYKATSTECKKEKTCESDLLDCFLLDDNGFIVASKNDEHLGKFFGVIEGTIMESLVSSETYNRIKIFDYQAVCLDHVNEGSPASLLLTPIRLIQWTLNWMFSNMIWVLVRTQLMELWDPNMAWGYTHPEPLDDKYPYHASSPEPDYRGDIDPPLTSPSEGKKRQWNVYDYLSDSPKESNDYVYTDPEPQFNAPEMSDLEDYGDDDYDISGQENNYDTDDEEAFPQLKLAYINKTMPRPCDKYVDLYKLNNSKLKERNSGEYKPVKGKLSNCHTNGCGRPFSVQKVIKSNLVLIVVHKACPCASQAVDIQPKEVIYNESMNCQRLLINHFRKRPDECHNYHPDELPSVLIDPEFDDFYMNDTFDEETDIKLCGGVGYFTSPPLATFLLCLVMGHAYAQLLLAS